MSPPPTRSPSTSMTTGHVCTGYPRGDRMTPEYALVMARYNRWMNDKLYAVAERLVDAERKEDRGAFFGSIHRTLNHLLLADRVWLGRFTGAALQEGELGPGGIR